MSDNDKQIYSEQAEVLGIHESYWSWSAKFADLDLDGWLDLYVGNGFMYGDDHRHIHSNVFFRNNEGISFERKENEFGLGENLNSPSFTYFDADLDGDLDIAVNTVLGPIKLFINKFKITCIFADLILLLPPLPKTYLG